MSQMTHFVFQLILKCTIWSCLLLVRIKARVRRRRRSHKCWIWWFHDWWRWRWSDDWRIMIWRIVADRRSRMYWMYRMSMIAIHQYIGNSNSSTDCNIFSSILRQTKMKISNEDSIHIDFVEWIVDIDHNFEWLIRLNVEVGTLFLSPDLIFHVISNDCIFAWTNANMKCNVTASRFRWQSGAILQIYLTPEKARLIS